MGAGSRLHQGPHSAPTLPEREEDDRLDGEELEDRLKWLQELPGGEVEKEQGVEGQADGDIVDEGDVEVATVDAGARADAGVRVGPKPCAFPAIPAWALPAGQAGRWAAPEHNGQGAGGSPCSCEDVALLPTKAALCPSSPVQLCTD